MSKEKAAGGKKKTAKGELRRNKLHIPHPVRRLRRTGLVRSVVPPFPTRIAALDSRGSPVPLTIPLKTTKKEAIPLPWNHHPSEYRGWRNFLLCVQLLSACRGRCPHRPVRICCFTVMLGEFVIFIGPMWASAPTSLRKSHTLRIPYVKYSTGTNETTRTACRALGKPDWTAARRAFLTGRAIGEWHTETKCLFRRDSAISRPSVSFLHTFF